MRRGVRGKERGEKTKKVNQLKGRAGRRKMRMKGTASEGEVNKGDKRKSSK